MMSSFRIVSQYCILASAPLVALQPGDLLRPEIIAPVFKCFDDLGFIDDKGCVDSDALFDFLYTVRTTDYFKTCSFENKEKTLRLIRTLDDIGTALFSEDDDEELELSHNVFSPYENRVDNVSKKVLSINGVQYAYQCGFFTKRDGSGKKYIRWGNVLLVSVAAAAVITGGVLLAVYATPVATGTAGAGLATAGGAVVATSDNSDKASPAVKKEGSRYHERKDACSSDAKLSIDVPLGKPTSTDAVAEKSISSDVKFLNREKVFTNPGDMKAIPPETTGKQTTPLLIEKWTQGREKDFCASIFEIQAQQAFSSEDFSLAAKKYTKTINIAPENSDLYIDRGISYLNSGLYEQSIKDFDHYKAKNPPETSYQEVADFSIGFATGLTKGVYESGEGAMHFVSDLVKKPVTTASQVKDAICTLVSLSYQSEWDQVSKMLTPEIHQLVTEWDTLSSADQGHLAGYALGKHGTDILLPGTSAKLASTGLKSGKKLAAIAKQFKRSENVLILETAASNGATVGKTIRPGQVSSSFANEVGTLNDSEKLFNEAQKFLKPYKGFMSESRCRELIHKTGIPTFPRPKGIPSNFRIRISDRGAGMVYFHPQHTHTSIRIMPGKPHSPYPHQQKPYVIHTKNGDILDKCGNVVGRDAIEAHIPLNEFNFTGD